MSAREILGFGRHYIDRGWPVFILSSTKAPVANCDPCKAEHTAPWQMEQCRCLTCHGFYAGTLDWDRFAEMNGLNPFGLLAVRTGAPSGTAVVDVDPKGLAAMRELVAAGLLPKTAAQVTGREGFHLAYAHPGVKIRSGANKVAPGIDSKADGGYIVVAPSVHPQTKRPYRWLGSFADELTPLPQHWIDMLREPQRPAPGDATVPLLDSAAARSRYAEAALRGELENLLALKDSEGCRNDELNRSAFSLGQLIASGVLDKERTASLLEKAGARIGLRPGEIRLTVASGLRAGALYPRSPADDRAVRHA